MRPYNWKHLLKVIVELVSMSVLVPQGGVLLIVLQGWGGVKCCCKMCSSNFGFQKKFVIFPIVSMYSTVPHFKNCAYLTS